MKSVGAWAAAGAALLVLAGCGSSSQSQTPEPIPSGGPLTGQSIPLFTKQLPGSGGTRVMTEISIAGGPKIPIMVDTGSQGLRVFSSAVGTQGLDKTTTQTEETFGQGSQLSGVIANAPVTIGSLPTNGAIPFMLIENVSCTASDQYCSSSETSEAGIIANDFGAQGIMGIGRMSSESGVISPLLQLAGGVPTSYSIRLNGSTGAITFGQPPANPLAIWATPGEGSQGGLNFWNDEEVPACWSIGGASAQCAATAFDTGSPDVNFSPSFSQSSALNGSNPVTNGLSIGLSASQGAQPFASIKAGSGPGNSVISITPGGDNEINSGWTWFQQLTFTYGTENGQLSVAQ